MALWYLDMQNHDPSEMAVSLAGSLNRSQFVCTYATDVMAWVLLLK